MTTPPEAWQSTTGTLTDVAMPRDATASPQLSTLAQRMAAAGANLTVETPDSVPITIGTGASAARVIFHRPGAVRTLLRGDHLALAEAYLQGEIDVEGDLRQALFVTDHLDFDRRSRIREVLVWLRLALDRRRFTRRSIAHHYDRPAEFFLRWLDPSRSYTHGFYASPDEDLSRAQKRKLQYAIDALRLAPGMDVLDMGCGWGSFIDYAGSRGIRVHGITLSREQHAFVSELIREKNLPCTVTYVDFLDYQPPCAFDGAVFMGSLEHMPDYRYLGRFLGRHLRPQAGAYADFVTTREGRLAGAFLRKYIFPGVTGYVELPRLTATLTAAGFPVRELADDTPSCAYTVRDWALALQEHHHALALVHGEVTVRAFLLYLWSSHHFLATNRTQAYHLVVGRTPDG